MKKLLIIIFALTAVWLVVHPQKAFADYDDGQHEIEEQLEDMLADYDIDWSYGDISGMTFTELRDKISESTKERLAAPLRLLGIIISVILFTAAVRGTSENILGSSGQIFDTICVVTAAAAITPAVFTAYSSTLEAVERLSGFMLVFVPVFAGITIAAGGAVTGGTYSMLILGASTAFAAAVRSFLMPVLSVMAALSVSGSVFPERSVEGITALLKKIVIWGVTASMTLFTGFTGLRSMLAAKTDGAGAKTIKFMISGFVPFVGGAVSDAYSTVRGSFELMGSTVGTAGCLAIAVMILPPVIELICFRAVMLVGSAAAELFSAQPLVKLLKGIDSGLAIAQCILICYSVMLIICTGIVIQSI